MATSASARVRVFFTDLGQLHFDAEERIKFLAVRLAIWEKLASRIGVVRVAWSVFVVVGAFGYQLRKLDLVFTNALAFAETFRISIRGHELEVQAISRELESRQHLKWTKADFSLIPFLFFTNILRPRKLRFVLCALELSSAVFSFSFSTARLLALIWDPNFSFCIPGGALVWYWSSCQLSAYLFHGLTIVGSAVFLVAKAYFLHLLSRVRNRRLEHSLVFEKFSVAVYSRCLDLNGSIYDGLDMNLVVFGIQWLNSNKYESQLRGAKLLNSLIKTWHEAEHKLNSETADAVRKLGAYPGLMERLVEMLSWNNEDEEALNNEVSALTRHSVASHHGCSTFAAIPGALDAVFALTLCGAEKLNGGGLIDLNPGPKTDSGKGSEECRENCLQVLEYLAVNESTSAMALHQSIADFKSVIKGDPNTQ